MPSKLFKQRKFSSIFWTMFFGALNDNVYKNALIIMITYKGKTLLGLNNAQTISLCSLLFILPFFIFSAFAGQVADRYKKNKLIIYIKIWEVLVMLLAAIGFYFDNIFVLITALFLMGLQSTFFGPIKYSILPEILPHTELLKGNSFFQTGTFLSILIGTIIGGLVINLGYLTTSLVIIIFALLGLVASIYQEELPVINNNFTFQWSFIKSNKDLINDSLQNRSVFYSLTAISWFWFFGACMLTLFPIYGLNVLNCKTSVVTFFLALFSIGVAIGSHVCEKFSKGSLNLGMIPIGAMGMTLFLMDLFLIGQPDFVIKYSEQIGGHYSLGQFIRWPISWRITLDILMISVFCGLYILPLYTHIQVTTIKRLRSRIIAANNIYNAFFMVLSAIFLIVLQGAQVDTPEIFFILSIINLVNILILIKLNPSIKKEFSKFFKN